MIIFHAKRDGTVTTEPSFVPQGSALADLVVIAEHDYAYCTIKLTPSSGVHIPDLVCQYVLDTNGVTMWTAHLPAEAAKASGYVTYQLIFTSFDLTQEATLEGTFTVPEGAITNMPDSVSELEQMTVNELYALLASIHAKYLDLDISASPVSISTFVVAKGAFVGGSKSVQIQDLKSNCVALILPASTATQEFAKTARLSIPVETTYNASSGEDAIISLQINADGVEPADDLNFIAMVVRDKTSIQPKAYLLGASASGDAGVSVVRGRTTINTSAWGDGYEATSYIPLGGNKIGKGSVVFIMPSNDETRRAAGKAHMYAVIDMTIDTDVSDSVVVAKSASGEKPNVNLVFDYTILQTNSTDNPVVALVGVDAFGASGSGGGTGGVDAEAVASIVQSIVPAWARESAPPQETDPNVPAWAKKANKPEYTAAEVGLGNVDNVKQYSKNNPPPYPVTSVNGKTGAVNINATDIGAEMSGAAQLAINIHESDPDAHQDILGAVEELSNKLNAVLNSDDKSLDELKEIVAYIKSNKALIDSITDSKVSKTDIVNNLTTNSTNKPLSAAQGAALKSLVDALDSAIKALESDKTTAAQVSAAISTALASYATTAHVADNYQPKGDYATKGELAEAIQFSTVSIAPSQWSDNSPTSAMVSVAGLTLTGCVAFLFPADDSTKVAAAAARMTAQATPMYGMPDSSIVEVIRAEVETAPSVTLNFMAVVLKDDSEAASVNSSAVLVGVDSYGTGEGLTRDQVQAMINTSLGVIENGSY